MSDTNKLPAVVVVDGCRTPFVRSSTVFTDLSSADLGRAAVAGLLHKTRIDPGIVEMLVMGRVVPDPQTSNVAREVVFGTDLPESCLAYTVTMACVSSLQATVDVVRAIQTGVAEVGIAAGCETASDVPLTYQRPMRKRLIAAQKARGIGGYAKLLRGLRPGDLLPEKIAIAERTTGESMGQNAERLAKKLHITREAQDQLALASHRNAARAMEQGWLAPQIVPVYPPPKYAPVRADNGVRADTTLEKLASLAPSFDKQLGTITAGNASFLSDGGAAVLLMSEDRAARDGFTPLARVAGIGVSAQEPYDDLLLGPAIAMPRALSDAGIEMEDAGVVELHEAFAAQVLGVLALLEDPLFCRERLGRGRPVGRVDRARLNAWGGSLAIGHPFGATGARLVTNCAQRMQHEDARYGVLSACAAGGLGIGLVLERC